MKIKPRKKIIILFVVVILLVLAMAAFCVFFDEAVIVRKDTFYRARIQDKVVALTFDDGPSEEWTPKILDVLNKYGVKATFFMIGEHVLQYPEIAKRVAKEGHEIGNHTFDHHVLVYYKPQELVEEIKKAEKAIEETTNRKTVLLRPPKAWVTSPEKIIINKLGYKIILWSLNSKDWVNFDDKYIVRYLMHNIKPGDIILFHDSGGVFTTEGGNRSETIKAVGRLIEKLRDKGYRLATVSELLSLKGKN
ncbi:MAG: polysaccharide deacetylase family protein [Candidatus Omnitrophota bacterium]|jgi:peptidoglycan/xylan/chitin deacetylase (PgdA/CDA1 family)